MPNITTSHAITYTNLTYLARSINSLIGGGGGGGRTVCKNKMADLPLAKISEKKFRQQEIDLHQFTDEELRSRYRFGRGSMKYLVQILKNNLKRQTK